jgi:hypothetical protein
MPALGAAPISVGRLLLAGVPVSFGILARNEKFYAPLKRVLKLRPVEPNGLRSMAFSLKKNAWPRGCSAIHRAVDIRGDTR